MENVFISESVAHSFECATHIPNGALERIGVYLADIINNSRLDHFNLKGIDLGCGTGRTICGILNGMHGTCHVKRLYCLDTSDAMLSVFKFNRMSDRKLGDVIRICPHDLNVVLPHYFRSQNFDFAVIISVLQYLTDWKKFLKAFVSQCLKNGFLLQAEIIGWYRMLDGTFDECSQDISADFWQAYFEKRSHFNRWAPDLAFSRMDLVSKYCSSDLSMETLPSKDVMWDCWFCWQDVLEWIRLGLVSSLGSGLSISQQENLSRQMKMFLIQKGVDIKEYFNARWGMRLICHSAEQ